MSRKLLVVGALIVVALVLLWVFVRDGGDAAQPPQRAAPAQAAATTTSSPSASAAAPASAPRLPDDPAPTGSDSAREYAVGGMQVRDHRSGTPQQMTLPPNVHAPGSRRVPTALVSAISEQVKDVMSTCAQDVPAAARGASPRLEGQLVVAIKDHQLSVTSATVKLTDIADDAAAQATQCIEQKSVGLAAPAPDQDDLDAYSIRISYAVR